MAAVKKTLAAKSSVSTSSSVSVGKPPPSSECKDLAEVLGVRSVFLVEENEFLRDKTIQYFTLGLAGKRSISDRRAFAQSQVGTVWKQRILIVSNSMVMMFSVKGGATENMTSEDGHGAPDMHSADGEFSNLLRVAGDLKTVIVMDDLAYACTFSDPRYPLDNIVQFVTTNLTGHVRNIFVRMKSSLDQKYLVLEVDKSLKSYRNAYKMLRNGEITEDGYQMGSQFSLSFIGQRRCINGESSVVVLYEKFDFDQKIKIKYVCAEEPVLIYVTGRSETLYCASLTPASFQSFSSREESIIRLPATVVKDGKHDDESGCLYLELSFSIDEDNPAPMNEEDALTTHESSVTFSVRETHIVAFCCVSVLVALITPASAFERQFIILALLGWILWIMLVVRGKQDHKTITKQKHENDPTAAHGKICLEFSVHKINKKNLSQEYLAMNIAYQSEEGLGMIPPTEASDEYVNETKTDTPVSGADALINCLRGANDFQLLTNADCPQKWYDACDGRVPDALKQWRASLLWRRDNNIDTVLTRPCSKFFLIKKLIPHVWLGNDVDGNLVTLDHLGKIYQRVQDLISAGVTAEDFCNHCVWINEYWIQNKMSTTGRLFKIVDLKGLTIGQVTRGVYSYLEPMNKCMQQYPEMLIKVVVINAPSSFRFIWATVSPWLAKKTTEKIIVLSYSASVEAILSVCSEKIIPEEYGGTLTGDLSEISMEKILAQAVREVDERYAHEEEDRTGLDRNAASTSLDKSM